MFQLLHIFRTSFFLSLLVWTGLCLESTQPKALVRQDNMTEAIVESNINETNTENGTTTIEQIIVKLHFTLKETNVIPFLRDETFYRYDIYNITTTNVIELFNLQEIDLNQTFTVLQKLNISDDKLNVDKFEELLTLTNMTFNDFFEKLKNTTDLKGAPLQEALKVLNINPMDFSTALAFGPERAVYDALSEGMYSVQKFEEAAVKVGTNLTKFYNNVKAIILDQIKTKPIQYFAEKLRVIPGMDKTFYDDIWRTFDLNLTDVYRVANYKQIIDDIFRRLNENITLGIVTGDHEIVFHRKMYNRMIDVKNIIDIYAETLSTPTEIIENLTPTQMSESDHSRTLWSNVTLKHKIQIDRDLNGKNLQNCTYITMNNTRLIVNEVNVLNKTHNSIWIKLENGTMFNHGNPLICSWKLIGLASKYHMENNTVECDTFFKNSGGNTDSSSTDNRLFTLYLPVLCMIFLSLMY